MKKKQTEYAFSLGPICLCFKKASTLYY